MNKYVQQIKMSMQQKSSAEHMEMLQSSFNSLSSIAIGKCHAGNVWWWIGFEYEFNFMEYAFGGDLQIIHSLPLYLKR